MHSKLKNDFYKIVKEEIKMRVHKENEEDGVIFIKRIAHPPPCL